FTGQTINISTGSSIGVNVASNVGATINFNPTAGGNGLDIVTTNATGFNATDGGTLSIQGGGNSIQTAGGTAFYLDGVTIGAAGITFESISKNGGTASGIYAKDGGNLGFFTVTGTGSTANSGGIIQNVGDGGDNGSFAVGVGAYFENTS